MKKTLIILYDKTRIEVNLATGERISEIIAQGKNKFIKINGNMVAVSSISHLADSKEYYEQHPHRKKKLEPQVINFSKLKEPVITYSDKRHKIRLEKMKAGFLIGAKVKTKEELSNKQIAIFENMELALERLENNLKI